MAGSDKTVKVTLVAVASPYVKGMNDAATSTRKLGTDLDGVEKKSKGVDGAIGKATGALKGMAVGAAALAGTALVSFLSDAVTAAGDLEQSIGGVDSVFGDAAEEVHAFGKTAAQAVGLSRNEFNQLITVTGAMLKNKGMADFTDQSLKLVKVGADLAAQFGGSTKDAVDALNAAMRGESDPIERYGISLNETAVNAELAAKGLGGLKGAALDTAKAQARVDIIMRQSADSAGKFADEADTLQGQQQRLNAEFEDAKALLGEQLLPMMTQLTESLRGGIELVKGFTTAWSEMPEWLKIVADAIEHTIAPIQTVLDWLGLISPAQDDAADSAKKQATETTKVGDAAQAVAPKVEDYTKAQDDLKGATQKVADLQRDLAQAMLDVKSAASDADEAAIDYQSALDEASASIKENGRTLNINTEAGRNNKQSLIDLKDAALASAQANLNQGDSVDKVKGQMDTARDSFVKVATQMNGGNVKAAEALATKYGLTRDSVDNLKGSMDKIPSEVESDIKADISNAVEELKKLQIKLTAPWLDDRTVKILVDFQTRGAAFALNTARSLQNRDNIRDIRGYSIGGHVRGPGTATSDSIPAYLSDGEYVIKASAVQKYGKNFFDTVNAMRFAQGGYVQRFAQGGPVIDYGLLAAAVGVRGPQLRPLTVVSGADAETAARAAIRDDHWRARHG